MFKRVKIENMIESPVIDVQSPRIRGNHMTTFQQILSKLSSFWEKQGCIIHQGYDLEMGAGTFNPATFLRCLGPEPYRAAYIEPCRRPADGRYGTNPNRLQHYFQYQVMLKPSPPDIQDLYLQSLEAIGFDLNKHDVRFVHDDWEAPSQGAWGLGWEVWMDGMEITQFTYFQAVGGIELRPITGEITYGIERLAMYLQQVNSIFDLKWNEEITYGDIYQRNEVEWSHYNFENASTEMWQAHFQDYEQEARRLIELQLPIPAYDFVMKASHAFNLLDARGVISVTERTGIIARIRDLSKQIAELYIFSREQQGFPLLHRFQSSTKLASQEALHPIPPSLLNVHPDEAEDLLIEIGVEELPAAFVSIGVGNLERSVSILLKNRGIAYESIKKYATPRRLALLVKQLAKGTPSQVIEKKGPPLEQVYDPSGTLKSAGEGFFRTLDIPPPVLERVQQGEVPGVEIRLLKGIPYLFGTRFEQGRATTAILQEELPSLILNLDFPKKMRWGKEEILFARPLRWLTCLFGAEIIPFHLGSLVAGRLTYGHRLFSSEPLTLKHSSDYLPCLKSAGVMADPIEREESILAQIQALEKDEAIQIIEKERVLPQVLHLVEQPYLTLSSFDPAFLQVPSEVLISEMVEHQKYFPVIDKNQTLAPLFVITANLPPTEHIRRGNQRVLSARLSDGIFLYKEGVKIPLVSLNDKLKKVLFQKELGSLFQKVERLVSETKMLQQQLQISTPSLVEKAATLSKADLASGMVYEFPQLQGIIGKYYALAQKEDPEVAQAIEEQWMPRGEKAPLPESETGIILSLADKFDNLVGYFAAGLKPTSSSDPYGLRRQVLGIARILISKKLFLPLQETLKKCASCYPDSLMRQNPLLLEEVLLFIINRVRTVFMEEGFPKDEIEASLANGCADIYDTYCRIQALRTFRSTSPQPFSSLLEVYKRAKGQLNSHTTAHMNPTLLHEKAEIELYHLFQKQASAFQKILFSKNYGAAYQLIASFQPALARLFAEVKILAEDPAIRTNRLSLLSHIFSLFGELVDFGKIQEKPS